MPDSPTHVAFFRNLNLGQSASLSPTSAVLIDAFLGAGAEWATNVQTNGTVIFASAVADDVIDRVRPLLVAATGYADAAVVRPAGWVMELRPCLDPTVPGAEVALFNAGSVPELDMPWVDPSGNLTVLELDRLHAVTSWTGTSSGSTTNPTLTRMLGVPVTCRGVPTMIRLATRLSRLANADE